MHPDTRPENLPVLDKRKRRRCICRKGESQSCLSMSKRIEMLFANHITSKRIIYFVLKVGFAFHFLYFASCNLSEETEENKSVLEKKGKTAAKSNNNEAESIIYQITLKGAITPSTKEALASAIKISEEKNATALLVLLDTPGGLASSMDDIVQTILNASMPVITFVAPPGATCGSAGVYIMYASHVAAMAPATNIGSATPVSMGGGASEGQPNKDDEAISKQAGVNDAINLKRKILNHATAKIRSLAQYRKRNINFAERSVTEAMNLSSKEAFNKKVIDFLAIDVGVLLKKIHGHKVRMKNGYKRLKMDNVRVVSINKDFRQKVLDLITEPNFVYILMMLAMIGILTELQNPGLIFPGVIGAISLLLSLFAMQTLSLDYTALAFLGLAGILFLLEVYIVSYGLLSVVGIICIIMASIMFVRSGEEYAELSLIFVIVVGIAVSLFSSFMAYLAAKSQKAKRYTTYEKLMQAPAISHTNITSTGGLVKVQGELWQSHCETEEIPANTPVKIVANQGLKLIVEKK